MSSNPMDLYAKVISEQKRREDGVLAEEDNGLSKASAAAKKIDRDAYHVGSAGQQHAFGHDAGDRGETAAYTVHDTKTGKVHRVSVPLDDSGASHATVKKALGKDVHPDLAKHIHKDIKDNYAE